MGNSRSGIAERIWEMAKGPQRNVLFATWQRQPRHDLVRSTPEWNPSSTG